MSVETLQSQEECTSCETKAAGEQTELGWNGQHFRCDYGEEEDNHVRDIVISQVTKTGLKRKFYRKGNLSLYRLLENVSTYHNKDAMVLVSDDTVNRTWEDRGKGNKPAK